MPSTRRLSLATDYQPATESSVARFAIGRVQRSPYNPGRFLHILQNRGVGAQCQAEETPDENHQTLRLLSELLRHPESIVSALKVNKPIAF